MALKSELTAPFPPKKYFLRVKQGKATLEPLHLFPFPAQGPLFILQKHNLFGSFM